MRALKKRSALALTLGITGAMASQAVAQYTISNRVTATTYNPLVSTNTLGQTVNYGTLAVGSQGTQPIEANGPSPEAIIGTVTGLNVATNPSTSSPYNTNNTSAFEFDATYGFRIIGENTQGSNGTLSSGVSGENAAGQVIGTSQRDSSSSTSGGVLGTDAWISTTTGGTVNNATVSTTIVGLGYGAQLNFNGSGGTFSGSTAGTEYTYNATGGTFSGTYMSTSPILVDQAGNVVGTNIRYEGDIVTTPSTSAGQSAWYEPFGGSALSAIEIGLINNNGNYYNLTPTLTTAAAASAGQGTTTMAYYSNSVRASNSAGFIIGTTNAYTGPTVATGTGNTSLGSDAWEYSGAGAGTAGTINEIGGLNFTGLGTTTISATNSGTLYTATVAAATVTGPGGSTFTTTYGGSTPDQFAYGAIPTTGALGTSTVTQVKRATTVSALNRSGQVGLAATYYINNSSSTGQDAYIYTPSTATTGTYAQVGLTSGSFAPQASYGSLTLNSQSFVNTTGSRSSSIIALNDNGQATGTSGVYIAESNYFGSATAAWYASPSGGGAYNPSVQIGLYNTATVIPANESTTTNVHTQQTNTYNSVGSYTDTPSLMNKYGEVAGTSARYNSTGNGMGTDAWLYDPANGGTTYVIDAAAEATNTYASVNITYLSDSGVVIGQISTGSGTTSTGASPYSSFLWSENNPSVLLNLTTSTTGLSAAGLQNIANSYFAGLSGLPILSSALSSTPNSTSVTVDSVVALAPEPGSLSILGIGGLALLRRRRRSVIQGPSLDAAN